MTFPGIWRIDGVRGGRPRLREAGIEVVVIADRFAAGEAICEIAADYGVSDDHVLEAIRLMVAGAFGLRGVYACVERRMEALVPLETK